MNFFLGGSEGTSSLPPEKDSILKDLVVTALHTSLPPPPRSILVPPVVDGDVLTRAPGLCRDIIWKVRRSREAHPVRWTNWPINQPPAYLLSTAGPFRLIAGLSGRKVYTRPESNFERRHLDPGEIHDTHRCRFRQTLFRAIPAFIVSITILFFLFFSLLFLLLCFVSLVIDANSIHVIVENQ